VDFRDALRVGFDRKSHDGEDMNIQELQARAHATAVEKGWHDNTLRDENGVPTVTQFVAWMGLVHSEIVEAENETAHYYHDGAKPEGKVVELADVVIRLLDVAGACGFKLCAGASGFSDVHASVAAITERARKDGVSRFAATLLYEAVRSAISAAGRLGYDWRLFEAVIVDKMNFNDTRLARHGGKLA
jgi:hypothetical protein